MFKQTKDAPNQANQQRVTKVAVFVSGNQS